MKALTLGPRRGGLIEIGPDAAAKTAAGDDLAHFETFDLVYRALCALLYNYVPLSGHPGGSISSGRIVAGLLCIVVIGSLVYSARSPNEPAAAAMATAGNSTGADGAKSPRAWSGPACRWS